MFGALVENINCIPECKIYTLQRNAFFVAQFIKIAHKNGISLCWISGIFNFVKVLPVCRNYSVIIPIENNRVNKKLINSVMFR